MSTAPAGPPGDRRRFLSLPRRDFVFGGLAGLVAAKTYDLAEPVQAKLRGMPAGTQLSFAQAGEDLVAASLFRWLQVEKPTYLDVGAWEPVMGNNTYLFYLQGGRGVLVEPNPALTAKLRDRRPGDVVLEAGVGVDDTPAADYYVTSEPQMNTFDKDQVDRITAGTTIRVERVIRMPLLNINRVIREHLGGRAPDFLSVDVEGLDLPILKTLDFAALRPKVICAETLVTLSNKHNDTAAFLQTQGYEMRGLTHANTLFVDGRLVRHD